MKNTILIIDDDSNLLKTLSDILENEGYRVVTLVDPSRAEEFIAKHSPSLLIIDIFMPVRSGFNLMEDFRRDGLCEDIPKIFLTCLDDDIERMTARACGVERYLTKPFSPEHIIDCVKELITPESPGD